MFQGISRNLAIAAAAVLALGFGGGFLTAKLTSGSAGAPIAQADHGLAWPFFGKPRAGDAPRPAVPKPEGFAVWTTRLDTSGPQPLACVRFSRPLDPAKRYSDFVLVSPALDHAPGVTVRDDELCVAGVGFFGHRITLLKGLPARTGETLAASADADFSAGEKPPYVGFAGQGVILPREESDGVGIETLNVSKLLVEVFRVSDRNLLQKDIAATDPVNEGDYNWEFNAAADVAHPIYKGEMAVRAKPGEKAVTVFPLGAVLKELKPGAYMVRARDISGARGVKAKTGPGDADEGDDQAARASRWIIFTDMGLIAYQGSDGLDAVARSLKTAKTLHGVRIALVANNGEELASGVTDLQGHVRFPGALLKGQNAMHPRMLMAYGPQADLALLDLNRSPVDLSNQGVGGRRQASDSPTGGRTAKTDLDGYVYDDRGVYRPGETVHLVAMVRDRQAKAVQDRRGALVIRRPSGLEFQRLRFDRAEGGAVARDVVLPKTAPRGRWRATLEIDGVDDPVGELSFAVEDFAPQRLGVTLDGDAARPVGAGEARKIAVNARFLYGATGAGLAVQAEARLRADDNPFPQYKDYRFGDEKAPFHEKLVELPASLTDAQGRAFEAFDAKQAGDTNQPLAVQVTASVFEPGGRPVAETVNLKLRTKSRYFGVKPTQTSSGDHPAMSFDLLAVDAKGERAATPHVAWTLISENWDYDWFQENGKWSWRRTNRDTVVAKGEVDIPAAGARLNRRLPWGDYRLVLEEPKSGARTVIRVASGWGAAAKDADAPDMARVSAGPKTYAQGDTVDITLKAPYAGEAQVAVATDRLIDFKTLSVPKDGATLHLKTSAAWGGGAYVLVSVIQPRDPSTTPKPRRALGLVYVPLDPKSRKLVVELGAASKLDSHAEIAVPVTVKGLGFGAKAHVTLAAVDEGILHLTHQESPDPAKWYFGKRALTLDYRDDYGRLLDPNLGAPAAVNFGGDELGGAGLSASPIKTVALWSGVVETDRGGHATIKLPAADFNGELRLMAVAWTDAAVGAGSSKLTVHEPVVADLALPRFLAPGDHAQATLELHNLDGKPGAYAYAINGLATHFQKVVQLAAGQRSVERAPLDAPAAAGVGRVELKVSGPRFTTLKAYPIETRLGWGPVTRVSLGLQKPGEVYTPPADALAGLAAGTLSMTVSYSPFEGFDPAPIADALRLYPYGCSEQLVSAAFPLLYAPGLGADPRLGREQGRLAEAVGRLMDRQSADGAIGLWRPGDREADAWLGAYLTDFLVEARSRGAPVSEDALARAMIAMRQLSQPAGFASVGYVTDYPQTWARTPNDVKAATARLRSRAAAYALYVLAKANMGDLPRLRWWHDVGLKDDASPLARALVGAGLARMGDRARAHDSFLQAVKTLGYRDESDLYQSPLRDLAGVIALAYEAGELGVARDLQPRLAGAVKDPDALNTQEAAMLLKAADAMLRAAGPVRIDARGVTPTGANRWAVGRLAEARFVNLSRGPLWRTATVRGVPLAAPGAMANGLTVDKRYFTPQGQGVNLAAVAQGARIVVKISGVSRQGRNLQAVIDDALPAGFEIETVLSPEDSQKGPYRFLGQLTEVSVQEARDDRYIAAATLAGEKPFAVAYVARAVSPGDYFLPGVSVRDMYHASVGGRSAPGRLKVAPSL